LITYQTGTSQYGVQVAEIYFIVDK